MSDYIAEAVRIDAERYPDALPDEVIADMAHGRDASWIHWVIESLAAGAMCRSLSIHADGVQPDLLVEMIQHAKERRVNIHVRVPATVPLDRLRSLLVAAPEVISLDFVLDTPPHPTCGTLESHVMLDELRDAAKVCSTLLRDAMEGSQVDHGSPATWIVPRIVRRDRTRNVIERFFDTWIGSAGVAVIDAINPASAGANARIQPMPLPRSYRRRLSRTRLCITAAGDALLDPLGANASTQVGNVTNVSLEECWTLAQKLRREQGSYA
jgi:hypothetical protein